MPPPSGPRQVLIDDVTGRPIFGTGSGPAGAGVEGSGPGQGSVAAPNEFNLRSSSIALPVDVQSLYRTQIILSTALLAANIVYTGVSFDAINFRRITGVAVSDQAGSLAIRMSDDNTTFDTVATIAVAANTPAVWDVPIYSRYVRYIYTNGVVAQTAFRLSGYLAAA